MPRLFVGAPLPDLVKDYLTGLSGGVMGGRWQTAAQMHLTLRFIGEVDGAKARDIAGNLGHVAAPALTVKLDGIGLFGKMTAPRVLWAGLKPPEGLVHLHDKIDRALVGAGLEPEHRKFTPHITLARFNNRGRHSGIPKGLEMFFATHGKISGHGFAVEEFILYRSHLSDGGAAYEPLARYPLAKRIET
jgi:2'-5' RNA ligase